ncbi:DUF1697 domain-containing protein [Rhizobium sp. ARZ01]|uniref:DUF1697 domain-containing protein n=1 Tax=Rhizobium sp. ARZ01 TaxID=2769313 RepID=UPI0017820A3B|nr:DUF1697 domain-containing protein [Rhizobium sp. ARZ01]MBD9371465.1 DUF1697 domain-containing protein [Rhizobium sp. ARZ01]
MPVYVALLRAINVGGAGTLLMSDLKALCEAAGLEDVRTYIQSGNVLLRTKLSRKDAARMLGDALAERMGMAPGVMLRTGEELAAIAANNPFPEAKPNYLMVNFLSEPAPKDALDKMVAPDGEQAHLAGCEIYVHYPDGSGRSKLKLPALKLATARNLNTVRKLAELARQMEGG